MVSERRRAIKKKRNNLGRLKTAGRVQKKEVKLMLCAEKEVKEEHREEA